MGYLRPVTLILPLFVAGLGLTACGGGGGGSTASGTGELSMAVTDAPVDGATEVVVEFTAVELHAADGESRTITFDSAKRIDLLDLAGNTAEFLFEDETVSAGDYSWVRLAVKAERSMVDSYIRLNDGSQHSLYVPSGSQSGLKLNTGFTVPEGGSAAFTIDFDLRKSVHHPQGNNPDYVLRPTLRLLDSDQAGTLAGSVASDLVTTGCDPAVYAFEGAGVTPDDEDGKAPDPANSAIPELDAGTGRYDYSMGWLAPGMYTVTFTCDAADDDPATDDALTFQHTRNVEVTADDTAIADFP